MKKFFYKNLPQMCQLITDLQTYRFNYLNKRYGFISWKQAFEQFVKDYKLFLNLQPEFMSLNISQFIQFKPVPKYHHCQYKSQLINIMNPRNEESLIIIDAFNYGLNLYKHLFNFELHTEDNVISIDIDSSIPGKGKFTVTPYANLIKLNLPLLKKEYARTFKQTLQIVTLHELLHLLFRQYSITDFPYIIEEGIIEFIVNPVTDFMIYQDNYKSIIDYIHNDNYFAFSCSDGGYAFIQLFFFYLFSRQREEIFNEFSNLSLN